MKPADRRTTPDYLSIIVALGKRLNSLLHPQEQLYAYCEALMGISRELEQVYAGFFEEGARRPEKIYLFERKARGLMSLGWQALSKEEQSIFEKLPFGKKPKGRGSAHLLEEPLSLPPDLALDEEAVASAGSTTRVSATGAALLHSFPLRTASGPECWILLLGKPGAVWERREADRNALSVCTDMLSVSIERATLFGKVLHAKKEWERTVDAIRDVVMIIGPDWTVRRANRRVSELAAVPLVAMQGQKCYKLLAASRTPCGACPAPETFRTGQEATAEVFHEDRGVIRQCWSYPISSAEGQPASVAVYEKDMTEYKRMQDELVHAEKMAAIGQLASSVAHELNNPMSAVISLSQILLKEMDPALPCHEDLKNIEEAALRCKKIVEDLLVFSRKPQISKHEPVSLHEAIGGALRLLRTRLEVKGIVVKEDMLPGLPGIPIHPDPLQQVLINLISNAGDAMESGGILRLKAWREKKMDKEFVVLSVQDTGRGIPAHQIDRIFEPFYTTKAPGKGTGLGLSICSRLMEAFGGGIEVTSKEGKGTSFFVWFPLQRADVRASHPGGLG